MRHPGKYLFLGTVGTSIVAFIIPYLPFSKWLGFVPLPAWLMLTLIGITLAYMVATEITKHYFYAHSS
jgi:Mg2+-importing ATPase